MKLGKHSSKAMQYELHLFMKYVSIRIVLVAVERLLLCIMKNMIYEQKWNRNSNLWSIFVTTIFIIFWQSIYSYE